MLNIIQDKCLTHYNTFGFEAVAEYYVAITDEDQLSQALSFAAEHGLRYQVLSGGSNVLMEPVVAGLTLHMQLAGIRTVFEDDFQVRVVLAAGKNWHEFVGESVKNGWQGVESLALIPGLAGAAPVQNIGAYGVELKDVLKSVRVFDTQLNKFVELDNSQCEFSYRDSIFKRQYGRYIITAIELVLAKSISAPIKYKVLQQHIDSVDRDSPSATQVYQAVCDVRNSKLPDPGELGNAGSFFKNPCIKQALYQELRQTFEQLVAYPLSNGEVKLAAGWLIDQCGWRGYESAGLGVYPHQALVLTHGGGNDLQGLLALAEKIKESVFDKFQVKLEIEPQRFPYNLV